MGSPIVHFEIIGRTHAQLKEFYTQLFDWKIGDLIPTWATTGSSTANRAAWPAASGSPTTASRAPRCMRRCPTSGALDKAVAWEQPW